MEGKFSIKKKLSENGRGWEELGFKHKVINNHEAYAVIEETEMPKE